MGGEPWCFTPAEISPLTDHVIDFVYLKPAVMRAEAMERERKGLPQLDTAPQPASAPPNRQAMVSVAMSYLGRSREQAEADYDAQLAEWVAQQATR